MSIQVELSDLDYAEAVAEACRRHISNVQANRQGTNNAASAGWASLHNHIVGALGEMAVATLLRMKHLLFQDKNPVRGSVDLPPNIDVKASDNHNHRLIVQLNDDPRKRFVFVTAVGKDIRVHGFIDGHVAMDQRWIADPVGGRPAFFIPQSVLQPLEQMTK